MRIGAENGVEQISRDWNMKTGLDQTLCAEIST